MPYELKMLELQDAEVVEHLQQTIVEALPDAAAYYPLSPAEISSMLCDTGRALGVLTEEQLIAFQVIYFPGHRADNLGHDLGVDEADWEHVAHLEASGVHPDYRGNGLQKMLAAALMNRLQHEGKYFHLCATTAPDNIPSILNKLSNGMLLMRIKEKYNGSMRSLFYKNLSAPLSIDVKQTKIATIRDIDTQRKLIAQGYVGYRWVKKAAEPQLAFGKLIP